MLGWRKTSYKKNNKNKNIENLMEVILRPLRSKNARSIYDIFYAERGSKYLTTFDIEASLRERKLELNKKEINGFLVSLLEAGLIEKQPTRGKPAAPGYEDKYTYDLWRLTSTGFKVGDRLPNLMSEEEKPLLPKISDLTPSMIDSIEDLYITAKLLMTLHSVGGEMRYVDLRKKMSIDKEKLAVYSWPDPDHSDQPLFEVKVSPPNLREKIFRLFGQIAEKNLSFSLTSSGRKLAEEIAARESNS